MDLSNFNRVNAAAAEMRKNAIRMTYNTGKLGAHIGGGLSLIEVMAVLYMDVMHYDPSDMQNPDRDRLIFSKGHGTLALYTAMEQAGILTKQDLFSYKENESILAAHPSLNPALGIEYSSGSLGQGLSLGVGTALALKRKGNNARVFVILGDGECDEGSVWEAASAGAHYNLDNLIAIIDRNHLQYDGPTEDVLSIDPLEKKWESFRWETAVVNGHDIRALHEVLTAAPQKPYVIIADTVKGKGISFMENNPLWHNGQMNKEQYEKALEELGTWMN